MNNNNFLEDMKRQFKEWLLSDELDFLKEKSSAEKAMSAYANIWVHENSILHSIADYRVVDEPEGSTELVEFGYGNPLSVWVDAENCEEHNRWKAIITEDRRANIPAIPWNKVYDVRKLVAAPVAKDLAHSLDVELIARMNARLFDDGLFHNYEHEYDDSVFLDMVPEGSDGYILVNELTARDMIRCWAKAGFSGDNAYEKGVTFDRHPVRQKIKLCFFVDKDGSGTIPKDWVYFVPSGTVSREELRSPTVYTQRQAFYFSWFGAVLGRTLFDDEKFKDVKLLRFNVKEDSNE